MEDCKAFGYTLEHGFTWNLAGSHFLNGATLFSFTKGLSALK